MDDTTIVIHVAIKSQLCNVPPMLMSSPLFLSAIENALLRHIIPFCACSFAFHERSEIAEFACLSLTFYTLKLLSARTKCNIILTNS